MTRSLVKKMDFNKLRAEIEADPAKLGYAGKDAEAIALLLNDKNKAVYGDAQIGQVLIWAGKVGAFSKLRSLPADSPLYDAAQAFLIMLESGGVQAFHLGEQDVQEMAMAFVTAGVISPAQYDSLLDLGKTLISRADELGLEQVWPGHIEEALV